MANPPLVSMAQQFTGLPMGDLIGAPLKAAAEANQMMAITQTDFLLNTAFKYVGPKEGEEDGSYAPIMVTMGITRGVLVPAVVTGDDTDPEPKIEQVDTSFDIPLLTLLPLNSLNSQTKCNTGIFRSCNGKAVQSARS